MTIQPFKLVEVRGPEKKFGQVMRWEVLAGLCLLNGYRKGVELGVSTGRTTMYLCATIHDIRITAVDTWTPRPSNDQPGQQDYVDWPHSESLTRLELFNDQMFNKRIEIVRKDTVLAAQDFADGAFDFVFVDADHSFEGCKNDIAAWMPKVRKGGMICGHDYNWPTVAAAVQSFGFPNIAVFGDNVWVHQIK